MNRRLHRLAEQDLAQAVRFYKREAGTGVARRFLDEFERVGALLVRFPGIGTPAGDGRRVFPMTGFPYSVVYKHQESGLFILVVRHQSRDPDHGESRR